MALNSPVFLVSAATWAFSEARLSKKNEIAEQKNVGNQNDQE